MKTEKGECNDWLDEWPLLVQYSEAQPTAPPAMCCNVRGDLLVSHVEYCAFTSQMHVFLLYASIRNDNSRSIN